MWSAGCAAGQEPFSIAILLDGLMAGRKSPLSFRIIATDVSEGMLATALRGEYSADEMKNLPLKYIESCFSRQEGTYLVVERIRARVDFSTYNSGRRDRRLSLFRRACSRFQKNFNRHNREFF